MKRILTTITLLMLCLGVWAQTPAKRENKIRYNTKLGEAKIEAFIQFLDLNDKQTDSFRAVYTEYDKAMSTAASRHSKVVVPIKKKPTEQLTQEDVRNFFESQIALSSALIDIRRDYFGQFEKILSADQMWHFFQKENTISNQVRKEYNKRQQELKQKNNKQ